MLLDRAKDLASQITSYQRLQSDAVEAEQYATRAKQFSGAADRVVRSVGTCRRLADANVPIDFTPANAADLAGKARSLRAAVAEDASALQDPPFDLKYDFTDRLVSLASAADTAASAAWRKWVSQESRLQSGDILDALSAVPQFKSTIETIRQRRLAIASLAASIPSDVEAAKGRLRDLVAEHNKAWSDMTADGIPPAVMSFIKACAGEGASISMLTEEVRLWLDQRVLADAFRIRIR